MNNRQHLNYEPNNDDHVHLDDMSSDSSCSSSCCDYHSDESVPEWDSFVQENGELFFVKCSPVIPYVKLYDNRIPKSGPASLKSNKLSRFLRKHKMKKHIKDGDVNKLDAKNIAHTNTTIDRLETANLRNVTNHSAAILFLHASSMEYNETNMKDSMLYFFPKSATDCIIGTIKGALLTLYHVLPKIISEKPESSTIFVKEELVHLVYIEEDEGLMILAFPEHKCSLYQLKQLGTNVKRFLNFKYGSLHDCFCNSSNHANLDQLFGNIFLKLLKDCTNNFEDFIDLSENDFSTQFQDLFSLPSKLTVPINFETIIEEKLNEIEANDFGDLSEDHYGCQRLYTLIGTCLYYKGFLIHTHLNREDQLDIDVYLRFNDTLDLTITSTIGSLIIWQEVFLSLNRLKRRNCSYRGNTRNFLLVIGKERGLLVILFQTGGCSTNFIGATRPDELYVEQMQESIIDILRCGLPEVVEQLTNNRNYQKSPPRKSAENLANIHSVSTSVNESDKFSESLSRTTSSVFSDESVPVLGRRAQRMKQMNSSSSIYSLSHCNLSDSDRSDYDTTGSSHSSSFTEISRKSIQDAGNCKRIIHGDEKTVFYYLNLRPNVGIILHSINDFQSECCHKFPTIVNNFKSYVQKIHAVLSEKKNTSLGKLQRNTVSVKEYGILFEHFDNKDESRKISSVIYWIVGRVFNKPNLGEVYVCYEDKTPQNLVEVAFRLAMLA